MDKRLNEITELLEKQIIQDELSAKMVAEEISSVLTERARNCLVAPSQRDLRLSIGLLTIAHSLHIYAEVCAELRAKV